MYRLFIILLFNCSLIFSSENFNIKEKNYNNTVIGLTVGEISFDDVNDYKVIKSSSKGETQEPGLPELPTYTFNYSIEPTKNYNVEFLSDNFTIYQNIDLHPVQPMVKVGEEKVFTKNQNFYNLDATYPESKVSSKRMSMRGYELLSVEVIPFDYNAKTKELKVYNEVDVIITEAGTRESNNRAPRSQIFENMYLNTIINSDDYQDSRSFQKPSILYISGGSLASSSYLETLTDWRHKQGYVVNVASTSETGSSTTSIKNYIENAYENWENPPEHICLIGDANGSIAVPTYTVYGGQGWSSASGEGDFPYTLLEGNDLLPEVTIGRISIRSTSEFITAVNKIIGYEKNYANDSDWLNAIALVGDPNDSGISTVITNQYIEQIVNIHGGITDIRTKYSGGNDYDDWMRDQINDGVAYLNYRGFYGFSGFTSSDVGQLFNGYKLPFIATLTCGTGSFATETTCMTESLYRAGTSVSPKGAVAVIGTAQSYTHTAFNNIVDMGIFDGLFVHNVATAGEATVYGKLAINEIYPQNPNDNVYLFATWNNLLGDPATQMWTSSPKELSVNHIPMVINGSNNFQVLIEDENGHPLENIIVTLSREDNLSDELFETVLTGPNGVADFQLPYNLSAGEVSVVSRAINYLPDESFFIVSDALPELSINNNSVNINDNDGNNDGFWNPGENVQIEFSITNNYNGLLENLYADITSYSNSIALESNTNINIGNLSAGNSFQFTNLIATASNSMLDSEDPMLRLQVYSTVDDLLWNYIIPVDFRSSNIVSNYIISNENNGLLNVGETGSLSLNVYNEGSMSLEGLTATLNYSGSLLSLENNQINFGTINPGQIVTSENSVQISASTSVINGSIINIPVVYNTSTGFTTNSIISVQVGAITVNDPVGPDSHGYYIYDIGDTGYQLAPEYDWIEIDPDYGGNGDEVNVYDGGNNQDDVTTISLPFTFTFYGENYNTVSVCSNGWISFGSTEMSSFRNYTLPGPGGPSPIVAVFWDDLKTTNGGEIYSYYDQDNDSFIIEWSNLRTYLTNSSESFQIILFNTGDETPTGDDEMKLQYKDFNNTSVGEYPVGNYDGPVIHGQYCTVGIEDHLGTTGLQYTFNNSYSAGARTLSDQSALLITTRGSIPYAQPQANYSSNEFIFNVPTNEQETEQLVVSNNGEDGSMLVYDLNVAPYPVGNDYIDNFGYAWVESDNNNDIVNYEWLDIENDNTIMEFENNDTGAQIDLTFDFPFYDRSYSSCFVNPNGWIGFEEDSDAWNNQSLFNEETPSAGIFGFWDDLNPEFSGNEVSSGIVKYHIDDSRLVVWFDEVIHWTSTERIYDFQMILYNSGKIVFNYRNMQGDVNSATIGIKSPNGDDGLQVVYNDAFMNNELSVSFNSANWLDANLLSGNASQLASGSSAIYNINVNTANLPEGEYDAYVIVGTNAESNLDILPVTLNTQNSFILGDINQDSVIDVLDVVRMVSIIMGDYSPSNLEELLCDVNEDNVVNVQDIILVINLILN